MSCDPDILELYQRLDARLDIVAAEIVDLALEPLIRNRSVDLFALIDDIVIGPTGEIRQADGDETPTGAACLEIEVLAALSRALAAINALTGDQALAVFMNGGDTGGDLTPGSGLWTLVLVSDQELSE
jgi:hypothetical protein